jgi:hypothetical protein
MKHPYAGVRNLVVALYTAVVVIAGCQPPDGTRVDRTASSEHPVGAQRDAALPWTFVRLSAVEGEFAGVQPAHVVGHDHGVFSVIDQGAVQVVRFDSSGRVSDRIGGPGAGPGEFRMPFALGRHPSATLAIVDVGRREVLLLDEQGQQTGAEPILFRYKSGPVHWIDGYLIAETFDQDPGSPDRTERLVAISQGDTVDLAVVRMQARLATFPTCQTRLGLPRIFERHLIRWDAREDRIAVASTAEYLVRVFQGPREVFRLERDFPAVQATREMALEKVAAGQRVGDCTIPADELVRGRGFSPTSPRIRQVRVEPRGRIWVERYARDDQEFEIDVFSPAGDYMGTLPQGTPLPLAFLGEERALIVENEGDMAIRLAVYAIRR